MRFALAICAIFKDEAAYLREWLDFHLLMGVEHFYLYDNGSRDRSMEALQPYIERGQATVYAWPQHPAQLEAYNHCVFTHRHDCDWLACLDLDEFLFSPEAYALPEVLRDYSGQVGVGVNWVIFGSAGHVTKPSGGVLENFRKRGALDVQVPYPNLRRAGGQGYRPENSHVKSIVRPASVVQFGNPHFATYIEGRLAVSETGVPLKDGAFSEQVSVRRLRINHYWSKSAEEARRKFARGFADGQGARGWAEFEMHEKAHNSVLDHTVLQVVVARSRRSQPAALDAWQREADGVWRRPRVLPEGGTAAGNEAVPSTPAGDDVVATATRTGAQTARVEADRAMLELALPDLEPGARVLVVGEEACDLVEAWAGIDVDVDMLQHDPAQTGLWARRLTRCPRARVIQAGLDELQLAAVYDLILILGMPSQAMTLGVSRDGPRSWLKPLRAAVKAGGRLLLWLPNSLALPGRGRQDDIRRHGRHPLRERFTRGELLSALQAAEWRVDQSFAVFDTADGRPELAVDTQAFQTHPAQTRDAVAGSRSASSLERRGFLQLEGLAAESALAGLADAYLLSARPESAQACRRDLLWRRLVDAPQPGLRRIEDARARLPEGGLTLEGRRLRPEAELPVLLGQAVQADFSAHHPGAGPSLLVSLREAAAARQADQVHALLREWVAWIRGVADAHGKLPGHWLDATPARIRRLESGGLDYAGGHWRYRDLIEADLPLYLGLWALSDDPLLASLLQGDDRTKLMLGLCAQAGLQPSEKWLSVSYQLDALLSAAGSPARSAQIPDFSAYVAVAEKRKPASYQDQLNLRALDEAMRARAHHRLAERGPPLPELIMVVLAFGSTPPQLLATLRSLQASQYQGPVQLLILSDRGAPVAHERIHWLTLAQGSWHKPLLEWIRPRDEDWLVCVQAGDRLDPAALLLLAERATADEGLKAVYFDEDHIQDEICRNPVLKADFNIDMFRSYPYIGRGIAVQRSCCEALGGPRAAYADAAWHELLLRIAEQHGAASIGHIAELQYHAAQAFPQWLSRPSVLGIWPAAVGAHLSRLEIPHTLLAGALPGMNRVQYDWPEQPMVSIIIPTRDQKPLLQALLESLEQTAYPNYELLIVDNESRDPEACRYLDELASRDAAHCRVLRYPHAFNYSAMNNLAAAQARGEYLLLLNNDTAALHPEWLEAMLNHARRPEVGIVGAKLFYPDGKIQHAGVVLGLRGIAEHPFIGESGTAGGYMHRLQVDQNYSAVTAACLMIRKSIYEEVGGLDESRFKVSYNDVDLCLKVRESGHLIVWTPYARLMHHGSVSQNTLDAPQLESKRLRFQAEREAMEVRWMPQLANDPAYNRNFSLQGRSFELDNSRGASWQPFTRPLLPRMIAHPADATGCGHYRVRQPFAAMQREELVEGMVSEHLFMPVALARDQVASLVLQRQHTEPQRAAMKAYRRLRDTFMVYELDDYMLNLPVKSVHRQQMPKDLHRSLREAVAMTDRFVVSTECLAEELGYMHSDIRVVMNRLPVDWWSGLQSARRVGAKPRVGWGGGASHTGDLELIGEVVRELADEVEWVFFGMCPDKLKPHIHEFHTGVPIAEYPAKLASLDLDLALAPLEDNLFNACKSNLRLLEYGACGFPVVCSDLVTYRGDLPVTRVKNRFKDWVAAIRMHIHDLDTAAMAGDRLREVVLEDWMLSGRHLQAWRDAWRP